MYEHTVEKCFGLSCPVSLQSFADLKILNANGSLVGFTSGIQKVF